MPERPMRRRGLLLIVCSSIVASSTAIAAADGPQMTVSPAGEITLTLDGRTVASGTWGLRPDSYIPGDGPAPIAPGPVVAVTAAQDRPGHATIHEQRAAATADYDLQMAGEDLRILAHVRNADRTHALKPLSFGGLTFHFNPAAGVPQGHLFAWDSTYLVAEGISLFHPGRRSPVGCWWAADYRFGFSAFSESEFDRADLVAADWGNHENTLPVECRPNFYTDRSLPPGGSVDVTLTFRVTADRSLPHLLGAYKTLYDRRFPLPMYTPDPRPVGMFAFADQQHVSRSNPLGYHADCYRFDTPFGTSDYLQRFLPPLVQRGFIGTIFWSPGGYDPPMYPPDFDVWPKSVQANLPKLVQGFHDQRLRIGLCARPGDGVLRPAGAPPTVYRLSADDPEQMRVMLDRFRHARSVGFDMFYLDSIGGLGVNDVRILRKVRDAVGPEVLLYSEDATDVSLPYADRYCEWIGDGVRWDGGPLYAALRILRPTATWLCISRTAEVVPPAFAQLGLTPLVGDQSVGGLPVPRPKDDRPAR
jgi:hypothetical protein